MTGNPKGSKWRSTPNSARKRKRLEITLSPEALERLEQIADIRGVSKSEVVETMLFGGPVVTTLATVSSSRRRTPSSIRSSWSATSATLRRA